MFGANVELPCFCCLLDSCCIHLEMSKSKHNLKKSDKGVSSSFIWTDGEFELLLKVTLEYKTSKAIENVDWESCQQKSTYQNSIKINILQRHRIRKFPDSPSTR